MHKPVIGVDLIVITMVDFIDGSIGANSWVSAKGKVFDYLKRGVGTRERVSDAQINSLRIF